MAELATLYLLRHVKAGDRLGWEGPDRDRPATKSGGRQAEALVERYAGWPLERIVSSPYRRCLDSVGPLARARGLTVETADALAEGAAHEVVLGALAGVTVPTVWCTHADVAGLLLYQAEANGIDLGPASKTAKGSTWVLGVCDASFVSARYIPPPA